MIISHLGREEAECGERGDANRFHRFPGKTWPKVNTSVQGRGLVATQQGKEGINVPIWLICTSKGGRRGCYGTTRYSAEHELSAPE